MYQRIGILILLSAVYLFSNCSSLTHKRNEDALAKIKKAALVGFAVQSPRGFSVETEAPPEISQMFHALHGAFERKTRWKMLPISTSKMKSDYQKAYEDTMKGFQNKMPIPSDKRQFLVDGVMDNDCLRILGAEKRTALMKALGVDALITAHVDIYLNGTTVMGIGKRYPQTRLSFQVFTTGSEVPDWFEGNLEGAESKTSVSSVGIFNEKELHKLAYDSVKVAFDRISNKPS